MPAYAPVAGHFLGEMMPLRTFILAAAAAAWAGAATAATITIQAGDDDCFGFTSLGGTCPDDTEIPSTNTDNSTAADPAGTDTIGDIGTLDFGFSFDPLGDDVTSASVSIRTAGINLNGGVFDLDGLDGAAFFFNGTLLGTYYLAGLDAFDLGLDSELAIKTLSFSIAPGLLVTGVNTLRILPEQDLLGFGVSESYGVDFARLTVETESPPISAVPLPAGVLLLLTALGGLSLARARRSKG